VLKNAHAHRGWVLTHLKPNLTTVVSVLALAGALLARPALAQEHAPAEDPAAEQGGEHGGHEVDQSGHEGGHPGGGGIENWFSLSFGPGKKHQNGPFAFAILNFVVLVWLVVRFGKKPFVQYLENRHTTIRDNLAESQRMREEAKQRLDEIKGKLQNLEREIAEIKASVRKDAELEKERFIAEAQSQAEALVKSADKALDDELRRARRMLEQEAVSAAMEAAEKLIRQQLNDGDRKRINEEYYQQIANPGGGN
jgi:F-type H+-transporting ATPase subunit b